ncbi:alpha-glucan family phosphorylase [Flammeovirgaceae bacterium SG7u.111]|nr:alpha-glucan family phosphorylase [Flammeovirgaceae bacterium SG7u.132]WPO35604.1 alpha-glucan family phosphorylase [Flammeovirgaceae bacterium SG7u.111]
MKTFKDFKHPYKINPQYKKRVAYFSMEFAIAQPLKIYSGGLGFLAGSHMRSAYELKQNLVGIGILWKYGYYDQIRKGDQSLDILFQEKLYSYLEDTGIIFDITVNNHPVKVKAFYLPPNLFGNAPMFFLSTDLPENDYLAQTISHKLYDSDMAARVAQNILLGVGGAKLLDELEYNADIYHFNEAHALPAAFYLYNKYQDLPTLKKKIAFTTHTPEEAGNEKSDIRMLNKLGFFCGVPLETVREISGTYDDVFNHTLVGLRFAGLANGVSKLHGEVSNRMWKGHDKICKIISITNAQNKKYWADKALDKAAEKKDFKKLAARKRELKEELFEVVADQTGKIFDPDKLTIVWARRFAAYKRADLIASDEAKFKELLSNKDYPFQMIWAGKPYPMDYGALSTFNRLVHMSKRHKNMAVLVGYELKLSALLKKGSDVWLNNPRLTREASGTSGQTAAMNGSVNFSTYDGWMPEFAKHGKNSFIVPEVDISLPHHEQDHHDYESLVKILEKEILPTYYDKPDQWWEVVTNSMKEVSPQFESGRMADDYYKLLYSKIGK